jgi:ABC-2 type transport system permease protein
VRLPGLSVLLALWGFALASLHDRLGLQGFLQSNGSLAAAFHLLGVNVMASAVGLGLDHPLLVAATLVFAVGLGTRSVAGELSAGTLDLALTRPVSRSRYLTAYVVVIAAGALVLMAAYIVGVLVAEAFVTSDRVALRALLEAAGEGWLLMLAIAGYALALSARARDGGTALTAAIAITLAMYVLAFVARLWDPIAPLGRLSVYWYYDPTPVVAGRSPSLVDVAVLTAAAVGGATLAYREFLRRDL